MKSPTAALAGAKPNGGVWQKIQSSGMLDWAIVLALVFILLIGGLLSPVFLSAGNLTAILVACSILVVVAVGQTFVIITAGIDLAIGSMVQLSSVMVGLLVSHKMVIPLGIASAILMTAAMGVACGLVVTKGKITDFIATLGMLSIAQGLALVISNARPVTVFSPFMSAIAGGKVGPIPVITLIALVIAISAHFLLFHTRFGTHLFAVGGNAEGAKNMGLKVDRIKITAFVISGILAGIGGILLTARIGSAEPTAGSTYLLSSVAAAVLGGVSLFGGRGTILGPVVGALVLTSLLNLMTILGVGVFFQPIVTGFVVILFAIAYRFQQ